MSEHNKESIRKEAQPLPEAQLAHIQALKAWCENPSEVSKPNYVHGYRAGLLAAKFEQDGLREAIRSAQETILHMLTHKDYKLSDRVVICLRTVMANLTVESIITDTEKHR